MSDVDAAYELRMRPAIRADRLDVELRPKRGSGVGEECGKHGARRFADAPDVGCREQEAQIARLPEHHAPGRGITQ